MSASVSGCSCSTSDRDSSGETTEKNGFSVVAAISTMVRSSTAPSSESCWVLGEPVHLVDEQHGLLAGATAAGRGASSMTARTSLTPAETADSCAKCRPMVPATSVARVVLPVPGGP